MNKKIRHNFSWLSIEIFVRVFLSFVVTTFLIRKGGPKFFGEIEYALAFLGFLEIGSQLANSEVLKKEIIKNKERSKDLVYRILKIFTIYYSIVFLTLNLILWSGLVPGMDDSKRWVLSILSIGLFFGSHRITENYFDSIYKAKINVLANSFGMVTFNIFRFLAIAANPASLLIVASYVYKKAFMFIVTLHYLVRQDPQKKHHKYRENLVETIFRPSLPLLLVGAMSVIFSRFDILIISYLMDDVAVGQYSAANKIIQPTLMFVALLSRGFFPQLVNYTEEKRKRLMTFIFGASFYIALAMAIFIWLFGEIIILQLFGDSYWPSIVPLKILGIGNIFLFWSTLLKDYEVVTNNTSHTLGRFMWPIAINIVLNFSLIPSYGINGAAFATLISYFFLGFGYGAFTKFGRPLLKLQIQSLLRLDYRKVHLLDK